MKKTLKISFCVLMVGFMVFAVTQSNYFHVLNGNNNSSSKSSSDTKQTVENNIGKYEAPVYFTIFKFISNYLPFKESEEVSCNKISSSVSGTPTKA